MNLKKLVKKNKILSSIAYFVRQRGYTIRMKRYRSLAIESDKVLMYRSGGGYGDNPRAVADYIHSKYPEMRIVWAYSTESQKDSLPFYISPVLFESEEYFRQLSTAGAWVCSTTLPKGTIKRKGQLYIQTWHGDKGFKKFANDAAKDIETYGNSTKNRQFSESEICDFFLTGSRWFIPKIKSAIGYDGEIIARGLPRNDCLINFDPNMAMDVRKKLAIPQDKKILIYAPTFRDHEGTHEVVASDIDLPAILKAMEQKTKERWICLLRAHAGRELRLDVKGVKDNFIDVTAYPDIADLLMISDMMITDYSSCAGDFALINRFILLYQDDIDSYTTKDRTLYFDMNETPYFVAHNLEEAIEIIKKVDTKEIKENCAAIREFYGVCETGRACEEVASLIIKNKRRLEKKK